MRIVRGPAFIDHLLFAFSAALTLLGIAAADEPTARPALPLGYVLGVVIAAPVLLRRVAPGKAVVISAVLLLTYYTLGFPGFSPVLALAVPLYLAAVTGHLRAGVLVAAAVTVAGALSREVRPEDVVRTLPGSLTELALIAGALLLGDAVRGRRLLRDQMTENVRRAVRETQREADQRAMAERLGVARDLHDVLAHTMSVIGVQANVAGELFDADPPTARRALDAVRSSCADAMADLGNTIRLLRVSTSGQPVQGLTDVPELIERTRRAGPAVRYTISGEPAPLRPSIDLTAYRIVQEALTNVIRHSRASTVAVDIEHLPAELRIRIADDGVGSHGRPLGHGLAGMRERVTALRGDIAAGDGEDGGFAVSVRLPVGP